MFEDYECDCCHSGPILNLRYHCEACPDYDLCEKCFELGMHEHPSSHRLTPVDGRSICKDSKAQLFQVRDQNLLRTSANRFSKSANMAPGPRETLVKSSTKC